MKDRTARDEKNLSTHMKHPGNKRKKGETKLLSGEKRALVLEGRKVSRGVNGLNFFQRGGEEQTRYERMEGKVNRENHRKRWTEGTPEYTGDDRLQDLYGENSYQPKVHTIGQGAFAILSTNRELDEGFALW